MLVEDRHSISILTENVLYPRLRAFDTDCKMTSKARKEKKQEAIKCFIAECASMSTMLSAEEVSKLVHEVLKRTQKNIRAIKRIEKERKENRLDKEER